MELLGTPIRITDRFNIQRRTRVFKLEREKLDENPIPSYFYFGKYKFRVRYQGQKTTCGYCAEDDHVKQDFQKKANLRVLAKTSRLQRKIAKSPTEDDNFPPGENHHPPRKRPLNRSNGNQKQKKTAIKNRRHQKRRQRTTTRKKTY